MITPNEKEARFALSDQISGVRLLSSELYNRSSTKWLMLKLGKRGVLSVLNKKHDTNNSYISIDSFSKSSESVGAGDALLAYSTLSYLKTKNKVIASIIGTIAASLECELDGNITIKPNDIINRIDFLKKLIFPKKMRLLLVGYGNQGKKREKVFKQKIISVVDKYSKKLNIIRFMKFH